MVSAYGTSVQVLCYQQLAMNTPLSGGFPQILPQVWKTSALSGRPPWEGWRIYHSARALTNIPQQLPQEPPLTDDRADRYDPGFSAA
jgi:hypothetical protein